MSLNGVTSTAPDSLLLNGSGYVSLQLLFAQLQLKLAGQAKEGAMARMKEIESAQEEQKVVADLLNKARQLKGEAGEKTSTAMPKEMVDYMDKHKLPYDTSGNDKRHYKDQWDVAIQSLQSRLDELGANTQQQMVYIQDLMGQYNSYLQGANTQVANSNQTLTSLAKGQ